jgi:hypothetical protein
MLGLSHSHKTRVAGVYDVTDLVPIYADVDEHKNLRFEKKIQ